MTPTITELVEVLKTLTRQAISVSIEGDTIRLHVGPSEMRLASLVHLRKELFFLINQASAKGLWLHRVIDATDHSPNDWQTYVEDAVASGAWEREALFQEIRLALKRAPRSLVMSDFSRNE